MATIFNRSTRARSTATTPGSKEDQSWLNAFRLHIPAKPTKRQKEVRQQAGNELKTTLTRTSDSERVGRTFKITLGNPESLCRDEEEDLIEREKEERIMNAVRTSRVDVGSVKNHRGTDTHTANPGATRTGTTAPHNTPTLSFQNISFARPTVNDTINVGRQRSVDWNHPPAEASHRRLVNASRNPQYTGSTTQSPQDTMSQPITRTANPAFLEDRRPISEEPQGMHSQSDSESESESGSEATGDERSEYGESDSIHEKGYGRFVAPASSSWVLGAPRYETMDQWTRAGHEFAHFSGSQRSMNVTTEGIAPSSSNGDRNGTDATVFPVPTRRISTATPRMTRAFSDGTQNNRNVEYGAGYSMPKPMNYAAGRMGRTFSNGSQNGRVFDDGEDSLAHDWARPIYRNASSPRPGAATGRQDSPTPNFTTAPLSTSGLSWVSFDPTLLDADVETEPRRPGEEGMGSRKPAGDRPGGALMRRAAVVRKREQVKMEGQLGQRGEALRKQELGEEAEQGSCEIEGPGVEGRQELGEEGEHKTWGEWEEDGDERREEEGDDGNDLRRNGNRVKHEERRTEHDEKMEDEKRAEETGRNEEHDIEQIPLEGVREEEEEQGKCLPEEESPEPPQSLEGKIRQDKARQEKRRSVDEVRKVQENTRLQMELHRKYEERRAKRQDEMPQKSQRDQEKDEARKKHADSRKLAEKILYGGLHISAAGLSNGSEDSFDYVSPLSEAEQFRLQEEHARTQQEQFSSDVMKAEQKQLARAAKAAWTSSKDRFLHTWADYELAWSTLDNQATLNFKTIPWPTLKRPALPEDLSMKTIGQFLLSPYRSQGNANKERVKEQLQRWNPDLLCQKWMKKVVVDDKDSVKEGVARVFRSLNGILSGHSPESAMGLARWSYLPSPLSEMEWTTFSETEWRRRQEEYARMQQDQFNRGSKKMEQNEQPWLNDDDRNEHKSPANMRRWVQSGERDVVTKPVPGVEGPRDAERRTIVGTRLNQQDEEWRAGQQDTDFTIEWQMWWQQVNALDMLAVLEGCMEFDIDSKIECLRVARSAKIYQRLVAFVYAQTKMAGKKPAILDSLRSKLKEWDSWDDHLWLSNHHIIRNCLWNVLREIVSNTMSGGVALRNILIHDLETIKTKLEKILADRQQKKAFMTLCGANPVSVMDLLQTLLDTLDLPMQCQSQFAQTLARLAKSTACYPDSLILGSVCRIGKDPMAGGGFADVWKGRFGEKTVALKAFRIFQKKPQEKAFNALSHEAVIWRQLKHPNILPFYGVFKGDEDFDRLCLVSPWMDAGNIMEYIDRRTDCNRITLLADVSSGLEYLHNFKPAVIHGDLKGANILVNPFTVACLADFGLARFRSSEESSCSATTGNSGAGTLRWQAPELFSPREGKSSQVCQETDVYSFGCVCIEVMTGKIPFAEIRQDPAFVIAIMNQQKPQRPNEDLLERGLDDSLWATMMQCWDADPSLRPSALQLVQYFEHRKDLEPRDSRKFECFELPETLRTSLGQYGFPDDFVAKVSGEQVLV